MKKVFGITFAVALVALFAFGGANAANAAGSDSPTPYTVTASGVQLPGGDTFRAHGHVNWRTTSGSGGMHFDPNNGHPGGAYIGKSFFPIQLAPGECITWVQASHYNEHFGEGGQAPVCAPAIDPPFEGATKYAPTVTSTCDAASFSHPAIKTGFGIANVYGVRYGATQAEAQAKPFEAYIPNSVVAVTFEDRYVANTFYFEVKVGFDGQTLKQQIGQTRGTSEPCERPEPPIEEPPTEEPSVEIPAEEPAQFPTEPVRPVAVETAVR